ncbi:MAG: hypothetical protein GY810_23940 [Aureispira sp.]|nr:hypothetical protein [Aureispira sp.]
MFGLMQPKGCCSQKKSTWYRYHRMHYCGTCKAIGKNYSQKARLFLNYDTVFLSELLSQLNKEELEGWTPAYQAINKCFTMPQKVDQTPFSLEYAAAANTVLSALKVDDNIKDQKKWRWLLVNRLCKGSFQKAFDQFETWGVSKDLFLEPITTQYEREKGAIPSTSTLEEHLDHYANPTSELTALIFENGAKQTNPESAKVLGYNFGKLMYILDAFEDLEEDIFTKQFNPLISWFNAEKTLKDNDFDAVRTLLLAQQNKVIKQLEELPLTYQELYAGRLQSNIALRIYQKRYIPTTWRERITYRWQKSKEFANQITCDTEGLFSSIKYFLVAWSVFLVPAVAGQMPQENGQTQWEWKKLWKTIFRFGDENSLLDDEQTFEVKKKKKKKVKRRGSNFCSNYCCIDCCSGIECSSVNEGVCFLTDCCSSWTSCCKTNCSKGSCCSSSEGGCCASEGGSGCCAAEGGSGCCAAEGGCECGSCCECGECGGCCDCASCCECGSC